MLNTTTTEIRSICEGSADQLTFQVQVLCNLVVLLEECPPVPHVPVLLNQFGEDNRCDPRECNGEENGELVEEEDVLVLYMFRE